MRTSVIVIGIIVLLVGVGLLAYGLAYPNKQSGTKQVNIFPQTNRTIDADGTWSPGAQVLSKGEAVTVKFAISNYSSSMGPVFLYVQNLSQFIAWGSCAPCTSPSLVNQTLPASGTYTLTWSAPYNDSFYFSFDNEIYNAAGAAVFVANATLNSATNTPNTTFLDSGAALILVGAIIIAVGVIVTGSRASTKPPPSPPPAAPTQAP